MSSPFLKKVSQVPDPGTMVGATLLAVGFLIPLYIVSTTKLTSGAGKNAALISLIVTSVLLAAVLAVTLLKKDIYRSLKPWVLFVPLLVSAILFLVFSILFLSDTIPNMTDAESNAWGLSYILAAVLLALFAGAVFYYANNV